MQCVSLREETLALFKERRLGGGGLQDGPAAQHRAAVSSARRSEPSPRIEGGPVPHHVEPRVSATHTPRPTPLTHQTQNSPAASGRLEDPAALGGSVPRGGVAGRGPRGRPDSVSHSRPAPTCWGEGGRVEDVSPPRMGTCCLYGAASGPRLGEGRPCLATRGPCGPWIGVRCRYPEGRTVSLMRGPPVSGKADGTCARLRRFELGVNGSLV